MNTIVIDCGASFLKGALIKNGKIEKQMLLKSPAVHNGDSIFELQQIAPLQDLFVKMVDGLSQGESEFELCVSNEMHGFILTNENFEAVIDYCSWQKEYGNIKVDNISAYDELSEYAKDYITKSGMQLRAGLPSCNLHYLIKRKLVNVEKERIFFYTLGDYLLKYISGKNPSIHPTNAAATGLYDIISDDWNKEYIALIGAENVVFPKVGDESFLFEFKDKKVFALPAIGDQQAALLGAGFDRLSDLSFNLGTGAQVSKLVTSPNFSENYQIRPYFNNYYLKTVPHIPSGRALNVYFRFVKSILSNYGMDKTDEEIWEGLINPTNELHEPIAFDLSFFENAITSNTKGIISEISEFALSFENFKYSLLNQMVDNFLTVANRIDDEQQIKRLIFSGGVARRIDFIRKGISKKYENAEIVVSKDETLIGLYNYVQMKKRSTL